MRSAARGGLGARHCAPSIETPFSRRARQMLGLCPVLETVGRAGGRGLWSPCGVSATAVPTRCDRRRPSLAPPPRDPEAAATLAARAERSLTLPGCEAIASDTRREARPDALLGPDRLRRRTRVIARCRPAATPRLAPAGAQPGPRRSAACGSSTATRSTGERCELGQQRQRGGAHGLLRGGRAANHLRLAATARPSFRPRHRSELASRAADEAGTASDNGSGPRARPRCLRGAGRCARGTRPARSADCARPVDRARARRRLDAFRLRRHLLPGPRAWRGSTSTPTSTATGTRATRASAARTIERATLLKSRPLTATSQRSDRATRSPPTSGPGSTTNPIYRCPAPVGCSGGRRQRPGAQHRGLGPRAPASAVRRSTS